ncbi:MAG: endolytic transglycosylase MltG [Alphaproteobacteria bacterium]|nr:MAG: endolytic transglycosylase MltG [Alphaproteobacteria bacterium]
MWKHVASTALTLAIVALLGIVAAIGWGQRKFVEEGPLARAICFQVPRGATMRTVADKLEADGAIASRTIFLVAANYSDRARQLKAGSFRIPARASMAEILDTLTRAGRNTCGTDIIARIGVTQSQVVIRELEPESNRYEEVAAFALDAEDRPEAYAKALEDPATRLRVAVAEGTTSWQVVNELGKVDFLSGEPSEVPPEGWLAPESYEVEKGADRDALLARMRARQEEILAELWPERDEDLPIKTPEEALILASIIEKETGVPDERRLVASVFVNRLRKGMRLQTDPTVVYGITQGKGPLGRGLRQSELRAETPYNTYVIDGLPPTPICNPGRASIEAALHPADSPYVFFVADGSGGHAFAATIEEHNRNVAKWREIERARGKN